uniref:Uncharacterized protein n=1 Tax=Chenopodium quinoa TaxID=63459 RepID=A0A803N921_CHEQI
MNKAISVNQFETGDFGARGYGRGHPLKAEDILPTRRKRSNDCVDEGVLEEEPADIDEGSVEDHKDVDTADEMDVDVADAGLSVNESVDAPMIRNASVPNQPYTVIDNGLDHLRGSRVPHLNAVVPQVNAEVPEINVEEIQDNRGVVVNAEGNGPVQENSFNGEKSNAKEMEEEKGNGNVPVNVGHGFDGEDRIGDGKGNGPIQESSFNGEKSNAEEMEEEKGNCNVLVNVGHGSDGEDRIRDGKGNGPVQENSFNGEKSNVEEMEEKKGNGNVPVNVGHGSDGEGKEISYDS